MSLGPRILRTETAAIVGLTCLDSNTASTRKERGNTQKAYWILDGFDREH